MKIDVHVHIIASVPGHGKLSGYLRKRPNVILSRLLLGIPLTGADDKVEAAFEQCLIRTIGQTPELDAAVGLAFDAVYTEEGVRDDASTHLHVSNEYAAALARANPKVLFGASVHPYRVDAVAELEKCVAAGAVLVKWLPLIHGMDPASERCAAFYEALAHHRLPLLCHTGGELSLPQNFPQYASPELLIPALRRGVTVIAAHCGTRSQPFGRNYLPEFMRMAAEYEHFYGDTSALCLPTRSYAFRQILEKESVRRKLVHGSDWPVISLPPLALGLGKALSLSREGNWMRRDVLTKQALGLDDDYFHRAGSLLRLSDPAWTRSPSA
jgi:uncharacterized protein